MVILALRGDWRCVIFALTVRVTAQTEGFPLAGKALSPLGPRNQRPLAFIQLVSPLCLFPFIIIAAEMLSLGRGPVPLLEMAPPREDFPLVFTPPLKTSIIFCSFPATHSPPAPLAVVALIP